MINYRTIFFAQLLIYFTLHSIYVAANGDLWQATEKHNHDNIRRIISEQPNAINAQKEISGLTALHVAAMRGCITCVKILISADANPTIIDGNGEQALAYALRLPDQNLKGHISYRILEALSDWHAKQKKR